MSVAVHPEQITLTWVGNPQTTQSITWSTKVTPNAGKVQYAEAVEGIVLPKKNKIVAARVEKMVTNLGEVSIHSATLVGLKPGMRYLYRVSSLGGIEPHAIEKVP